ncbi:MAG: hypothetical protein ACR2PT_00745, partial [Endozoicomonas sp.]
MKIALIVSLGITLLVIPLSQVIFGELHVELNWATEIGLSGPLVDGNVVVSGLDYLRFFRTPQNYVVQNWHYYVIGFLIAFISSTLV